MYDSLHLYKCIIIYKHNQVFHGNDFTVLKSPTYSFANTFHVVVNNPEQLILLVSKEIIDA